MSVCFQAFVELPVCFRLVIGCIKSTQTVVVAAPAFAQSVSEGKAQIAPVGVVWGYVGGSGFYSLGDYFNVGTLVVAWDNGDSRDICRNGILSYPIFGVEFFLAHIYFK
jgi:hypothetical protein